MNKIYQGIIEGMTKSATGNMDLSGDTGDVATPGIPAPKGVAQGMSDLSNISGMNVDVGSGPRQVQEPDLSTEKNMMTPNPGA